MKPDVLFGLESAAWAALLVNADGGIAGSNAAARALFGRPLEEGAAELAAIWATANGTQPAGFLAWWEKHRPVPFNLQFRLPGGLERKFAAAITPVQDGGGGRFLLQLLPWPETGAARPVESHTEFRTATGDVALRQRLDCALQLARSVSLDFNNALTGVVAHTSLLLGKAEPQHPWRRSLLEI